MVLGHRVVDLPFDLKDRFVQVGLAHALAASGFQVSILLAVLLKVTEAGSPRYSLLVGLSGLLLFGLSSGFEPSVSRAVLMGIAGLGSVASQRQLKPVGLLLLVAIVLLIIQPLWIWDLGFQLSFLATLGLLVTVPPLTQRLDWLPPAIASLLAVPIAAMLWTLPLQLYQFGVAPLYCLLANLCTTPFLIILTIGGFSSAVVALISPWAGSALAWLLSAPTQGLIGLVTFLSQLPGNSLTLGTISVWQLVMLYGLLVSAWLLPFWRKRLPLLMTLTLGVVILPIWQIQTDRFQITLFDRASPPMMVLQQPGATLVLNSGDRNTASQTLIPFLQRQGIDHIDLALATDIRPRWREGWPTLLQRISIGTLAPISISETTSFTDLIRQSQGQPDHIRALQIGERLSQKQISVTVLRHQPTLLQLSIDQQTWLVIIGSTEGLATWLKTTPIAQPQVVWWVAQIEPEVLRQLNPQVLVLTSRTVNPQILTQLQQKIPQVYWTPRDGAIQWRRDRGFERTLSPSENPASPL
jgi:competence protein ComEC